MVQEDIGLQFHVFTGGFCLRNLISTLLSHLTREGVHARGIVDGQHSDPRLLFEQIDGASWEAPQFLSDLLPVEAIHP